MFSTKVGYLDSTCIPSKTRNLRSISFVVDENELQMSPRQVELDNELSIRGCLRLSDLFVICSPGQQRNLTCMCMMRKDPVDRRIIDHD